MRKMLRLLPAAAILAIAVPASAQVPEIGIVTDDCTTPIDPSAGNPLDAAELYAVKVPQGSGDCTDLLFDLRATGGQQGGGADASGLLWGVPPNWRAGQLATDTQITILVYPPAAAGQGHRISIDSDDTSTQDFGISARQTIGNSIPSSYAGAGLAGIDLTLPGGSATYGVKLAGTGSTATANFPQMAGAAGVLQAVEVAFAPLIEVNNVDWTGNGCSVAGRLANQATASPAGNDGAIIGYNVYRVTGTAGTVPTPTDFYNASIDADPATGWQYMMPLTSSFTINAGDPAPGAAGTNSPIDSIPNDLGGLQNADGSYSTGDEVMIFQDSLANRGTARATGTAPVTGTSYWYAFQPVMCGNVSQFASLAFSSGQFNGDHATSVSALAAGDDAVDLDLDGNIEFFSPQADAGLPGLGLAYNGLPALSAPVFADGTRALPATGDVTLTGNMSGANVNITFQAGMQSGNVQGFNVYRGAGDARVRVNEQLILAQGTESSVYQLVDDAVQARRLSKGGSVQYMVEIVYNDGHTSLVGPFAVAVERQAPARRSR